MEKCKFNASDVLEQLLINDDSDFSGFDSNREEGEDVYAYQGPTRVLFL